MTNSELKSLAAMASKHEYVKVSRQRIDALVSEIIRLRKEHTRMLDALDGVIPPDGSAMTEHTNSVWCADCGTGWHSGSGKVWLCSCSALDGTPVVKP